MRRVFLLVGVMSLQLPALAFGQDSQQSQQSDVVVMRRVLTAPNPPQPSSPTDEDDYAFAFFPYQVCDDDGNVQSSCIGLNMAHPDDYGYIALATLDTCLVSQSAEKQALIRSRSPYYGRVMFPAGQPFDYRCIPHSKIFSYAYSCYPDSSQSGPVFACWKVELGVPGVQQVAPADCANPQTSMAGDQQAYDYGLIPVGQGVDGNLACGSDRHIYGREDTCSFRDAGGSYSQMFLRQTCFDITATPVLATDISECTNATAPSDDDRAKIAQLGLSAPDTPPSVTCANPSGAQLRRKVVSDETGENYRRVQSTFSCHSATDDTVVPNADCSTQIDAWQTASRNVATQSHLDYAPVVDMTAGTMVEEFTGAASAG